MPNVAHADREVLVSGPELGALLNLSPRHVQQLARDGIIPKASRGRYPRDRAITAYVTWLQARVAQRGAATDDEPPSKLRSIDEARQELILAQTEGVRLKNEEARGRLLPADRVGKVWAGIISAARSRLRALPRRAKMTLGLEPYQVTELQAMIDQALEELADEPVYDSSGEGGDAAAADDRDGDRGVATA